MLKSEGYITKLSFVAYVHSEKHRLLLKNAIPLSNNIKFVVMTIDNSCFA